MCLLSLLIYFKTCIFRLICYDDERQVLNIFPLGPIYRPGSAASALHSKLFGTKKRTSCRNSIFIGSVYILAQEQEQEIPYYLLEIVLSLLLLSISHGSRYNMVLLLLCVHVGPMLCINWSY